MKLTVAPNDMNNLDKLLENGTDAFIFGLKDFSVNYYELTIDEIKELSSKYSDVEFFISINRTIYNKDLSSLENILNELNDTCIKGVLFYDLGILSLYRKKVFKYDLVWHQTHMVTNYNTVNYYYDKGVKYSFLASEITKDEMIEIKKNTNMKLFSFLIGHPIMSHSKRHLLTNYYNSINESYDGSEKTIFEKDNLYYIKENKFGTSILEGSVVNGIDYLIELKDNMIDYAVIHGGNISIELLEELVRLTSDVIKNNSISSIEKIKDMIGNNTGFFDKKTIFRVKKNEE